MIWKAKGTGDGTAVTERGQRVRAAISQAEILERAIRMATPREIARLMSPRMKPWDIDYVMEMVHFLGAEKRV